MRILFASMLVLMLPSLVQAAPLTLGQCLAQAHERNPALRLARTNKAIAVETVRLVDADRLPRLDLQGGYTAQIDPQAIQVNGVAMETQQSSYLFGTLSLQHTLYDFGRRTARSGSSRAALDAVQHEIQHQERDTMLQVVEGYLAVLEAQKNVFAAEQELRAVEEHRRVAQALYESGSVTRNDLLQADVRLAHAHQQLLVRRNLVENLYLQLNFLTGMPPSDRPELVDPVVSTEAPATPIDPQQVLQQRSDLRSLQKQLESREQERRESRLAWYPEIFARLSLDYLENDRVREQTIYAGTIGITFNLFDGFGTTARHGRAVAAQAHAAEQLRVAQEQALLESRVAGNDRSIAAERINVTREAIRQGEENLRINQDRYQERVGTASDVLDAQTLLTQTRIEHYRALYDYQRAAVRLRRAVGDL